MDERLRELWRRFHDTGEPAAEASLLAERLRVGDVPRERLTLTRMLRHPASLLVEGVAAASGEALDWIEALDAPRWDEALRRAAVALARDALASCAGTAVHEPLRAVLARAEAWVACPCATCGDAVEAEVGVAYARADAYVWSSFQRTQLPTRWSEPRVQGAAPRGPALVREYYRQETEARRLAAQDQAWDVVLGLARAASLAAEPSRAEHARHGLLETLRLVRDARGDDTTLATIRAEVVPWAFGYQDPASASDA